MRAVILAGGKGSRLGPICNYLPKPLVPVGGVAIAEILIRQLVSQGFRHITFATGHCSSLVVACFGDGSKYGARIDYSHEETPLGTMGPLRLIQDLDPQSDTLVVNGDVLTDLRFSALIDGHAQSGAWLTVATHGRTVTGDFGELETEGDSIVGFREKPKTTHLVSMGAYVLSPEAIQSIPTGQPYGFDDLILAGLADSKPVRAHVHSGYWLDIGRPADYERANEEYETMRPRLLP